MRFVSTPEAPQPRGHYSQATVHRGVVYVAGQLPVDPTDPDAPPGDVGEQTRRVLGNLEAVLRAAGTGLDHVLQMTVFVSDISLWPEVNRVYSEVMGSHKPARAVVPVGPLHGGYVLEIQAIAAVEEGADS